MDLREKPSVSFFETKIYKVFQLAEIDMKRGIMKKSGWALILLIVVITSAFLVLGQEDILTPINPVNNISEERVVVAIFWGHGCPHCAEAKPFLEDLANRYEWIDLHEYEVYHNSSNRELWQLVSKAYSTEPMGVPTIFVGDKVFVGFTHSDGSLQYSPAYSAYIGYANVIRDEIFKCHDESCDQPLVNLLLNREEESREEDEQVSLNETNESNENKSIMNIPVIGRIDTSKISLPLLTIIIAGLDGFNPCAMWVLTFLLSLLVYTHSRKKMLIVGSIFVITSGVMYFLFMAAWLNFFLLVGYVNILRILVGAIAIIAGLINVKDFFWFKKGVSLTIPESAKPKLIEKMRRVVRTTQLPATILGTIILAVTANAVEGLCTAGFPAIYTRILTLRNLPTFAYYAYLALYNAIYVIPYALIVAIFVITLGARRLTAKEGKILKLISGLLMLILGALLIFRPEALMFG